MVYYPVKKGNICPPAVQKQYALPSAALAYIIYFKIIDFSKQIFPPNRKNFTYYIIIKPYQAFVKKNMAYFRISALSQDTEKIKFLRTSYRSEEKRGGGGIYFYRNVRNY